MRKRRPEVLRSLVAVLELLERELKQEFLRGGKIPLRPVEAPSNRLAEPPRRPTHIG